MRFYLRSKLTHPFLAPNALSTPYSLITWKPQPTATIPSFLFNTDEAPNIRKTNHSPEHHANHSETPPHSPSRILNPTVSSFYPRHSSSPILKEFPLTAQSYALPITKSLHQGNKNNMSASHLKNKHCTTPQLPSPGQYSSANDVFSSNFIANSVRNYPHSPSQLQHQTGPGLHTSHTSPP